MAWVGSLERQPHGVHAEDDAQDFSEIDVEMVRTFVITPTDVNAEHVRRDFGDRVVERLDVELSALEEVGL